ncbi:hypothetical protein [Pseudoalteromonas rubra]|uniref:hypothetical protein n=1 Tax=Pseudoalteromonas rubra TaxID=43658 RepID=UPI000F78358B|nr:hypothetical protein [Pseudoalteromonas rubra]
MYDIYTVVDHLHPIFIVLGLVVSWNVPTARWFLISYSFIVLINLSVFPVIIQWNTHYYVAEVVLAIAFMLPVIYRRGLALLIYQKTQNNFFKKVYDKQSLTIQECVVLFIYVIAVVVNFVTWLEVLAYKYDWIQNAYIKLYIRDNVMLAVQLLLCGCLLSYAVKAGSREINFEKTR